MAKRKVAAKRAVKVKKVARKVAEKGTCFVIMPFGEWFDEYYTSIYAPAIQAAGLDPRRTDDLYRPSAIVNDIWECTKAAKVILADLTDKNPNVFYELGLAHATAKPAVLVTASIVDVPFDLRGLRIIEYDKNDPDWGSVLKDNLERALRETLQSPLSAVLPTFLAEPPAGAQKEVSQHDRALLAIRQDVDMLTREVRGSVLRSRNERDTISADQARRLIDQMCRGAVPDGAIVRALVPMGVPERWIGREIARQRHEGGEGPEPQPSLPTPTVAA